MCTRFYYYLIRLNKLLFHRVNILIIRTMHELEQNKLRKLSYLLSYSRPVQRVKPVSYLWDNKNTVQYSVDVTQFRNLSFIFSC